MKLDDIIGLYYQDDLEKSKFLAEQLFIYYSVMIDTLRRYDIDGLVRVRNTWQTIYKNLEFLRDNAFKIDYVALFMANTYILEHYNDIAEPVGYRRSVEHPEINSIH